MDVGRNKPTARFRQFAERGYTYKAYTGPALNAANGGITPYVGYQFKPAMGTIGPVPFAQLPASGLPGDIFANRRPDPVLQQAEDFGDGTVSVNDCFRPVSRYFDRIMRPEQLIPAMNRAMVVLTDPAECGPVTLAFCQDVQAEAYDYPESFFAERVWTQRRARPDEDELAQAVKVLRALSVMSG